MVFPTKDDKAFRITLIVFTLVCLSLLVVFQNHKFITYEAKPNENSKELDHQDVTKEAEKDWNYEGIF